MAEARIKICGLTRREDAQLAAGLGAWALGCVFYSRSPRAVTPAQAAEILAGFAGLRVGVFVNADYDQLCRSAEAAGLSHLQLHGDEPPELAVRLQAAGWQVIKALRLRTSADTVQVADWPAPILLDAAAAGQWGGSGQLADWQLAAQIAARQPVILAGGLGPENLSAALATVRPWAVDLSSGVEAAPGIKDPARLRALFLNNHAIQNESEI